jgi:ketosteroid isomerase-like protein
MIDMAPTTADTMQRYFDTWKAHGFDDLQALLADNVTFKGPLGTADDAASYRAGIEDISKIMTDIVIHTMAADGENVVALFDLHTTEADEPVLVANWAQVGADRRIKRIRLTFDPPPILS